MAMKFKTLKPSQIMTTKDFPVYNGHILKIYFRICQKGHPEILPPTPVIPISKGLPLSKNNIHNKRIRKYFKNNPKVKYIMVDGSHKTTALVLTHNKIKTAVLESNKDIKNFREKISTGEILSLATEKTIKDILREKAEHYSDAEFFETVEDKAKRMVK